MSSATYRLSLAAWSLHRMFFDGSVDQLGMIKLTGEMGFEGFEMVNTMFPSPTYRYLGQMKEEATGRGVELLLIMCDGEGELGAVEKADRAQAVRNHRKWVDIAQALGCHSIRVNVGGDQSDPEAFKERGAESLSALLDYCAGEVKVLLENHWGLSSDPQWLVSLIEMVNNPGLGTLPDFGNFPDEIDRYDAVRKMMPYAGGVSAKCYDFDDEGEETKIDFARMAEIVKESGYAGFIGVEYEGKRLSEPEGIAAAKRLLQRVI